MELVRSTTALEQKWLTRIILKEMKLHITHQTMLKYFHPDAPQLYNTCSDLQEVATKCRDLSFRLVTSSVRLFSNFRPMLAQLMNERTCRKLLEGGHQLTWESKFDGERVQVHFSRPEKRIAYFSRSVGVPLPPCACYFAPPVCQPVAGGVTLSPLLPPTATARCTTKCTENSISNCGTAFLLTPASWMGR